MKIQDITFRSWYYLQLGWQIYFAIIFAFINLITLWYAFVIDDFTFLKNIFPSYMSFAIFVSIIIFTVSTIIGFKHFKSGARRGEIDVNYEVNPYFARKIVNSEMVLKTYLIISKVLVKASTSEKLTEDENNSFIRQMESIRTFLKSRTMSNKLDIKYIRTETQESS